jgi:endoglucanase
MTPHAIVRGFAALAFALATACGSSADSGDPTSSDPASGVPTETTNGATVDVGAGMTGASETTSPTSSRTNGIRGESGGVRTLSRGRAPSAPPAATTMVPPPTTTPIPFRGVNLAGGEFGSAIPGTDGVDYQFPNNAEIDYFVAKGMNTFRIGFLWERLQPTAYGSFVNAYVARLDALVAHATAKNANVILNPHNFARYYGNTVGSTQVPNAVFADLWSKLATRFKGNSHVMFNLVNEPNSMPTEQWVGAANAAIAAIRAAKAPNTIIVPGNAWTGAFSWYATDYGTSNAVAMLNITDPANNVVFEVHQYLDGNAAGEGADCVNATIGSARLAPFVKWLRDNGKKGFVGEFAGGNNTTCNSAVTDMLTYMNSASDVLVGWLWWAAGPFWGDYIFTLEPKNGADRAQMSLLKPFLF